MTFFNHRIQPSLKDHSGSHGGHTVVRQGGSQANPGNRRSGDGKKKSDSAYLVRAKMTGLAARLVRNM